MDRRERLLTIAEDLRKFGLRTHADEIEKFAQSPEDNYDLESIINAASDPRVWITKEQSIKMAVKINDAAQIIQELILDAEITGSVEILKKARAWLKELNT